MRPLGTGGERRCLPGGHARPGEDPRASAVRELREETGLEAGETDLSLLTVYPVETPSRAFNFTTHTLEYAATSGELSPEADGFEVAFHPVTAVLDDEKLRTSDRERIEMAFDA